MYSKENNYTGIYKIINKINNKFYIGSCVSSKQRKNRHWNELRQNIHFNSHLQRSVNKYGLENFEFKIIEVVEDKTNLLIREQYYLDTLKPDYNLAPTAGSQMGVIFTKERLQRMSELMSGDKNPMYGKTHPKELIEQIKRKNTENGTYDNFKKVAKEYNDSIRKSTDVIILKVFELENKGYTASQIMNICGITNTQVSNIFTPTRFKEIKLKYNLKKKFFKKRKPTII